MTGPTLCQCLKCERYLARNRVLGQGPQTCVDCDVSNPPGSREGIPLAQIRGTLVDPLSIEVLALISEECAETIQRAGKMLRWGLAADFEGTTQRHKFQSELGDIIASIVIADKNGQISLEYVLELAEQKIEKFRADRRGPQQRLLHAVPLMHESVQVYVLKAAMRAMTDADREEIRAWLDTVG